MGVFFFFFLYLFSFLFGKIYHKLIGFLNLFLSRLFFLLNLEFRTEDPFSDLGLIETQAILIFQMNTLAYNKQSSFLEVKPLFRRISFDAICSLAVSYIFPYIIC